MIKPGNADDTGRLSRQMAAAGEQVGVSADDLINAIVRKLAEKTGENDAYGGGGGGGGRKFLGISVRDWLKKLIGMVMAAAVFVITWYQAVNQGLEERPTTEQVAETLDQFSKKVDATMDAKLLLHTTGGPHPESEEKFGALEGEVRTIRESQIRYEEAEKRRAQYEEQQARLMNQVLDTLRLNQGPPPRRRRQPPVQ